MHEELIKKLRLPVFHHYCEDTWYSCPKHEDGCANDRNKECDCGADEQTAFNIKVAAALESCARDAERYRMARDILFSNDVDDWDGNAHEGESNSTDAAIDKRIKESKK